MINREKLNSKQRVDDIRAESPICYVYSHNLSTIVPKLLWQIDTP